MSRRCFSGVSGVFHPVSETGKYCIRSGYRQIFPLFHSFCEKFIFVSDRGAFVRHLCPVVYEVRHK
jgi:hypothetical protein